MTRWLYAALLWLHPPAFRDRFREELLCVFDEARPAQGAFPLLVDAAASLTRQWTLRSNLWIWCAALIGGLLPILIGYASFIFPMG